MTDYEFRDGQCYYIGERFKWPSYDHYIEKDGLKSSFCLNTLFTHEDCERIYQEYKGKVYKGGRIVKSDTIEDWCKLL